jgi:hypothetical protein
MSGEDFTGLLVLVANLATARKAHNEGKSDPSQNVTTGQNLYAAERAFGEALEKLSPDALMKMVSVKRAEDLEARVI